jgi:uncharacterized protein (DUF433 family)
MGLPKEETVMTLPDFLTRDADVFIRLTDHRIGLQHVIYYFNEGYSPEMLSEQFPTLPMYLIYYAIGFYLQNQAEVDAYLEQCYAEIDRQRATAKKGPDLAELRRRLEAKRHAEGA